jgi:hypothetical protein
MIRLSGLAILLVSTIFNANSERKAQQGYGQLCAILIFGLEKITLYHKVVVN